MAQEQSISLGDLARKERERKRALGRTSQVIESLDTKASCRDSWPCFLDALEKGDPAKMTFPDVVDMGDLYGVVITADVYLEIGDFSEAAAVLKAGLQNTTVKLTDPERKRLAASGMSADAIAGREKQAIDGAKRQDGLAMTCNFQRQALKNFLEVVRQGKPAEKDWRKADTCDGLDRTVTNPFGPYSPAPIHF